MNPNPIINEFKAALAAVEAAQVEYDRKVAEVAAELEPVRQRFIAARKAFYAAGGVYRGRGLYGMGGKAK